MKLLIRTIIALILIPLVIISIHYSTLTALILTLLVTGFSSFELSKIYKKKVKHYPVIIAIVTTLLVPLIMYLRMYSAIVFLLVLISLTIILIPVKQEREKIMIRLIFTTVYIGFLASFTFLLRDEVIFKDLSIFCSTFPLVLTWASDSGAYFLGSITGKHKLAPTISPKKTWEGIAGGIILALLTGIFYSLFIKKIPIYEWLIISVILSIMADLGDLFESIIKREYRIKDTSSFLSVHGGVLDRIDSLLFTIPTFYFYILMR